MGMDGSGNGLFEGAVLKYHRRNWDEIMRTLGKLYCV
jgi:hypothetical protein